MKFKYKILLFGLIVLILIELIVLFFGNLFEFLLFLDTFLATLICTYYIGDLS